MKLSRITSTQVSRQPDQTSEWLNRLAQRVDKLESAASRWTALESLQQQIDALKAELEQLRNS